MCRMAVCKKCGEGFTPRCPTGPAPETCYSCRSRICPECGKGFERKPKKDKAKDAGIFCSRKCSGKCKKSGRPIGSPRSIEWDLACWADSWIAEMGPRSECRYCKREAFGNLYCSELCTTRWHHYSRKPSACVLCGDSLSGLMYQSRSMCKACRANRSLETRKRHKHGKRHIRARCKKNGVPFDPMVTPKKVFERDHYICQMCNVQCLPKFCWRNGKPRKRSPTVDHIVPLAWKRRGHTWDNVQCCCWSCNVRKRDRFQGQPRFSFPE